ncbi:response regulator [Knoellia locipacati]|uniref:response regulator n=1 Tax=Knoellia locipacati TaxID=882824 RepID=UPI00384F8872
MTDAAPPPEVAPGLLSLAGIWQQVQATVLSAVDEIEDAVAAALEGRLDEESRLAATRAAHKLTGSSGTFGFHRASELARELESMFAVPPADSATATRFGERAAALTEVLRAELEAPFTPGQPPEDVDGLRLLVVSADPLLRTNLCSAASARGIPCRGVKDVAAARRVLDDGRPHAVLLDMSGHGSEELTLMRELNAHTSAVRVLVIADGRQSLDRVEAARAGAVAFLSRTLSADRMVEAVAATGDRHHETRATLLAVDDDPALLAALAGLFRDRSLQLRTLSDPNRFWEALVETPPDLLLLDLDMPGIGGLELCRLLRADPRWQALPVLVLTASTDRETVRAVFEAGADDYVMKPVVGPELTSRVSNRLERVRLYRQMAESDPLTGLANRRKFETEVDRLRAMSKRFDEPLSFAILDLDRFKRVNDAHGHVTGDRVLARLAGILTGLFRAEDAVARWGGEEFALAMYGMGREDAVARIATALESFRSQRFPVDVGPPLRLTFSAGVAQFDGENAADLRTVYRHADEALVRAKAGGGDRVVPHGVRAGDDGVYDVIVVEDDPAMVALLSHALETHGYRSLAISDGRVALRRLTGPSRVHGRVIVLDVDLPGLSGLDLLPQLGRAGILDRSKVIMLTARSGETETLAALGNGAVDHVAKPFSVPVLMQRLRRALAG